VGGWVGGVHVGVVYVDIWLRVGAYGLGHQQCRSNGLMAGCDQQSLHALNI
jgi:hypothetical protein